MIPHAPLYPRPAATFLNQLKPTFIDWLWPTRIPIGQLTLLIGDPGVGKSLFAADLAARVSAGRPWPDRPPCEEPPTVPCAPLPPLNECTDADVRRRWPPVRGFLTGQILPAGVILISPEDRAAEALQSRLAAAGADLSLISTVDGVINPEDFVTPSCPPPPPPGAPPAPSLHEPTILPFQLPTNFPALEQAIRQHDHPRLVILDPLQALLDPDAHGNPETLVRLLTGLADIARRREVAIVAVGHLIKANSSRLLYRVRGSLSFVAAARSVLLISADPDHPDRRVLSSIKTVFGPTPPPLPFRIVADPCSSSEISNAGLSGSEISNLSSPPPEISNLKSSPSEISNLRSASPFQPAPHLVWDTPDATRPWQLRADLLDGRPDTFSALSEACDWLWTYLAAGPKPARDLLADAHQAALNVDTLRRAKRLLAVRSTRNPSAPGWLWTLPPRTN